MYKRQALNLAIDRQEIIDNVGKAEQIPAYSFVPQGITAVSYTHLDVYKRQH